MSARRVTSVLAVVLVGLSAGFFFAYEASVTLGLADVDDVTYVHTFQSINETVSNVWFGVVFFGSIPAIGAALAANWRAGRISRTLLAAAFGLYIVGVAITGAGNVPLNDDLADAGVVTVDTAPAARQAFEEDWNRLNLTRTLVFIASFAALAAASAPTTPKAVEPFGTTG